MQISICIFFFLLYFSCQYLPLPLFFSVLFEYYPVFVLFFFKHVRVVSYHILHNCMWTLEVKCTFFFFYTVVCSQKLYLKSKYMIKVKNFIRMFPYGWKFHVLPHTLFAIWQKSFPLICQSAKWRINVGHFIGLEIYFFTYSENHILMSLLNFFFH